MQEFNKFIGLDVHKSTIAILKKFHLKLLK